MSTNQKPKSRLGRGLSSMISITDLPVNAVVPETAADLASPPAVAAEPVAAIAPAPMATGAPIEIPVSEIDPNPHQPRKQFNEVGILALAASIKSSGLVQPVVVRRLSGEPDRYQLIAGERRLRAAKAAGLDTIPALIREVDPFRQAQMALVENIQREDLNAMERAEAYQSLMKHLGLTQNELATRLGEDRSSITHYLRLLELTDPVQELVRSGQLTLGHGKLLAGVTDPMEQEQLANTVVSQGLSVRNLERVLEAAALSPATAPPLREQPSPHIRDLEKSITSQLGLRVQLRASSTKGKGKLIIHYTDLDQFDRLLDRMGLKSE